MRHSGASRGGEGREIHVDAAVAGIAARQHSLITRPELLAVGLTSSGIHRRIKSGRLHSKYPGVYAVGHPALTWLGEQLAAVLACGPGAVLSSFNAAFLWDLLRRRHQPIHVTALKHRRGPAGIVMHRAELPTSDVTTRHGIPVTTPTRTLLDLAAHAPRRDLERALAEAEVKRLVDPRELRERAQGRRGARAVRVLLEEPLPYTRSEAERRFLQLVARAGLPRPQTNVRIGRHEVDFLWPAERVVVEVDGFAFHGHRGAFEHDRSRDADLLAAGLRVLRVTWRQIDGTPEGVAVRLAATLSAAAARS